MIVMTTAGQWRHVRKPPDNRNLRRRGTKKTFVVNQPRHPVQVDQIAIRNLLYEFTRVRRAVITKRFISRRSGGAILFMIQPDPTTSQLPPHPIQSASHHPHPHPRVILRYSEGSSRERHWARCFGVPQHDSVRLEL